MISTTPDIFSLYIQIVSLLGDRINNVIESLGYKI